MEKRIQTEGVLTTKKAAYEKPSSQVYELEIEGAILQASGNTTLGSWSYDDDEWN